MAESSISTRREDWIRAALPVRRVSQGVLNIFDNWADPQLFDARLDFAIREWARRSEMVSAEVRRADDARLAAITGLFARFEASKTTALVRARTPYFMQIGYYALDIHDTKADRLALLSDYVLTFCGELPEAKDVDAFIARLPS